MGFKKININEIRGFKIGNAENTSAGTGCTVIISEEGAVAGVSCRGGAPATRELGLLKSENVVEKINAVVLSGGSAFGLEAASGVMKQLSKNNVGVELLGIRVPIVCGASIFDLSVGSKYDYPDINMGVMATRNAYEGYELISGNHGAGTGASVGKICGHDKSMKSGIGSYACSDGKLQVGAIAVVNAAGDVYDGANNIVAGVLSDDKTQVEGCIKRMRDNIYPEMGNTIKINSNTTISCIITNAKITKAGANKLADILNDAYARAIKPVHSSIDGDTIFVMSTNEVEVNFDTFAALSTDILQYSIIDGVLSAESAYGLKAAKDFK